MAKETPLQERYRARMIQLAEKRTDSKVKTSRGLFWTAIIFVICGTLILAPCCIEVIK